MEEIKFTVEEGNEIDFSLGFAIKEIEPKLQDKDITINENGTHSIVADDEYSGLNQVNVTVNAIEDLTNELETYDTELTEQETTIEDIVEALKNKGAMEQTSEIWTITLTDGTIVEKEVVVL